MSIKYYNRKNKSYEIEKVASDKALNWIYSSPSGMNLLECILKRKFFTKVYGNYCDSIFSKNKIKKFVKNFNIDTSRFENKQYSNFNDFFARKLAYKYLNKNYENNFLISPCDARVLAYENIDTQNLLQVKGITYSLYELIRNKQIIQKYKSGTCIVFRLCPTDYHRFHFIDDGYCSKTTKISGSYYSVNPIALKKIKKLFCENKREWSIFHSENFGNVLYVEVGATCVGSIIQTYTPNDNIKKGQEKGYFKFGGSTIILFFEKDNVIIDSDIINQTKLGFETYVNFGDKIGLKKNKTYNCFVKKNR